MREHTVLQNVTEAEPAYRDPRSLNQSTDPEPRGGERGNGVEGGRETCDRERGLGGANEPRGQDAWGGEARPEPAGGQVFTKVKSLTLNENPLPAHRPVKPNPERKEHKQPKQAQIVSFLLRQASQRVVLKS